MDNKKIAKYSLGFIGGKPTVNVYYSEDKKKTIDILHCKDDEKWFDTYSTIGLSNESIGRQIDNRPLGVELVIAGDKKNEVFANIVASCSFKIMDYNDAGDGMIIDDVVTPYVDATDLQHVILLSPRFWQDYHSLEDESKVVTWLQAVPITDIEKEYLLKFGIEEFEQLLQDNDVDVTDLHRKSIIKLVPG